MPDSPKHPITDEKLARMPAAPGVYLMKDAKGAVIYVGKAVNLRSRVRSYFSGSDERPTVPFLVARIRDIECIITSTESEAFLLENTLIKKYKPRYNLQMVSDITYLSFRIDLKQDFPRIDIVRQRRKDGAVYLGPYASGKAARATLKWLHRIFPLRQCSDVVMRNRTRPCILYDMKRCCGPCCLPVTREDYARLIEGAIALLAGKSEEAIAMLTQEMQEHSQRMEYEQAAAIRDTLAAIQSTVEQQRVALTPGYNADVIAHHAEHGRLCFAVLSYHNGFLNDTRFFNERDNGLPMDEIYSAFLGLFYEDGAAIPPEILTDVEPSDAAMAQAYLEELRGGACHLRQPQRGEGVRMIEIARGNAREHLQRSLSKEEAAREALEDLQRKLRLARAPDRIECYDISTLQGQASVASRVSFLDGAPDKSQYRKYHIKSVVGTDDFAAMHEVLTRRFQRLIEENELPPDLVIIDGGIGQLNVAVAVLDELGVKGVSLTGLAKSRWKEAGDARHRQELLEQGAEEEKEEAEEEGGGRLHTAERLFLPGRKNPIVLKRNHPALYLVQRIRDEAHRFAITFHRATRSKSTITTLLDSIPGVGPTRRKSLLRHFGSLAKIKQATPEEIAQAPGIPPALAQAISEKLQEISPRDNNLSG
ncbi:MAG: excinuclease ABC subunit UvrC [Candidatus Sumerlaeota bacterium]|nr:excinuclease ABC subunit UvrC [Candidatus Sumerlaeota bacterium]